MLIYGVHAAMAALENPRRTISRAVLTENALAKAKPLLDKRNLAPQIVTPRDLDVLAGAGAVHQGIAVDAAPLPQPDLNELLDRGAAKGASVVAMLDQVTDPHNVGAVLRSAAAFSIDAIIMQARHSPPIGGVLAKAASGALEHVALVEVTNLSRALDAMKEHGYSCVGFDSEATAPFSESLSGSQKLALVFGAEDKGLRRLVREACDAVCALPATGPIKSLNVSNAAAIAFYEASKAQMSRV